MRLLYTISGYGPEHLGFEMHRELAQEIIARGHAYTIWALTHTRHMRGRKTAMVEDGIPVHRAICAGTRYLNLINALTTPIFKFPWFVTALWSIVAFLRAHRDEFDLVIAEGAYPLGALIYLATRLVRLPFVVYVHGGDFIANQEANYGYARYPLARWFMRRVFHAAQLVKAESPYGAESAIKLGCPPEKMALVQRQIGRCCYPPAEVSLDEYRRVARERIRRQFKLTAPRLILTVGRLLPIKGFDDLIRGLPQVISDVGEVQVLHLGPNRNDTKFGNYQKHLQDLAQQLGVGDRVIYAGSVPYDQVRDFIAAADVVAVPSVQDSGNKLVMEAAAVATPFVSTNTAGNALWAVEWNCGLIVPTRSPDEFAQALVRVLSNPVAARQMGQRGLKFAERFSPEQVAERTLWFCECAFKPAPLPVELRRFDSLLHPQGIPA